MNEIAVTALSKWALFCVNHSNKYDARTILSTLFDENLSKHYYGKLEGWDWNWNELVISMDLEKREALFAYVMDKF